MHARIFGPLLAFVFASAGASALRAQANANVEALFAPGLKLTFNTYPAGRTLKSGAFESSSKLESVTLGARDILAELIDDGKIVGPLKGWKLVARCTSEEAIALAYRLFAVKAGQPDYPLDSEETAALDFEGGFAISGFKEVYHGGGFITGTGKVHYYVLGQAVFNDRTLQLSGNTAVSYGYKVLTVDDVKISVGMPKTSTTAVQGGMVFSEEGYEPFNVLISGSLKFSDHRILSLIASD